MTSATCARLTALALVSLAPRTAEAQWSQVAEQFYLPAEHNWKFRQRYGAADRLFNAFDYGHAILYETLYAKPDSPPSALEEREYDFITRKLLVSPPRVPVEERAIEVRYARLAPEAKAIFDWAHMLHRQIYDVWADERIAPAAKDERVAELLRYYRSRGDLALSTTPKSMELMEGQPYSLAFRRRYPKFNGLIWAYHWLQVGLYEPLIAAKTLEERQTGVEAAVARFRQMLQQPPENMPRLMPMTPAIAPLFAGRYPEAAAIFDNLHAMHDVISDILASPDVPRARKRAEILRAAALYRDETSFALTPEAWREMSLMMGAHNMGGLALAPLGGLPAPTVPVGATHADAMRHGTDSTGRGEGAHAGHSPRDSAVPRPAARDSAARDSAARDSVVRGGVVHDSVERRRPVRDVARRRDAVQPPPSESASFTPRPGAPRTVGRTEADTASWAAPGQSARIRELYLRMIADSVIRRRVLADSVLRRLFVQSLEDLPREDRARLDRILRESQLPTEPPRRETPPSTPPSKPPTD